MENEQKDVGQLIQNKNNDPYISDIFRPDYENQKLETNLGYQKWKSSMIDKYGIKGKIYKCPKDKIYFYGSDKVNEEFCPVCKKGICYFCSQLDPDSYNCCIRSKLNQMYKDGTKLSDSSIGHLNDYQLSSFTYFLIPGLNIVFLIGVIFNFSYYKLVMAYENDTGYAYECYLHKHYSRFSFILALNSFMAILLALSFIIYGFLISIIILILLIF